MALIEFKAIGQDNDKGHPLYLESESISSVEENPQKDGTKTCRLKTKNGDTYLLLGDPSSISKSVAPQVKGGEKIRAFFNSSLGIFCLSAVFVSGGGALWKWSTQKFSEHQATLARERLLLVEFDSRVFEMRARGRQIDNFPTDAEKGNATLCIIHLAGGTGICTIQNKPGPPLIDLVNELRGLGVKADPTTAFTALGDIEAENGEIVNSAKTRVYPPGLLGQRLDILQGFSDAAWKQIGKH